MNEHMLGTFGFLFCLYHEGGLGLLLSVLGVMAAVAAAAYFLGCFNGAVIVSKYILHNDIRSHGSGNAGLTNFYRVFGGGLTFLVILCDVMKAVLAVLIGAYSFQAMGGEAMALSGKYFAGMFCLVGHMFPCMFGFKGGKGVLSGGTVALMLDWRLALVVWGSFLILAVATKWVSLGSIVAGTALPVVTWVLYQDLWCLACSFVCGGLIVWKHRGNLKRILAGNESKFTFHRK